ncbi:CRCB-domain-containing protein [Panus rudis PR-1116 ss-1]|nr:CRCB-domain-containing protein [Panus rudis PR-1116 ss-1]
MTLLDEMPELLLLLDRPQHRPNRRYSVASALSHHTSVHSAGSLASIDQPPEKLPASKTYRPLSPHVLALLMPASVFGVLARIGIQALVGYDGHSIFPLAWAQFMGCLVMGFGLGIRDSLGQFYGPLYTALTTGFCGSLTTFSGWQLDVFQSWLNVNSDHRDWFRDVIDGVTKTVFTLALSLSAVQLGSYFAKFVVRWIPRQILPPPNRTIRYTLSALAVLVYAAAYPAYFRLPASFRHQATAALLFSFPGTLTRYLLSLSLNPLFAPFPLGTFTANLFGTALLGMFHVIQGLPSPHSVSPNACAVLQGLADGYCGCLTTVSTFAVEVLTLPEEKSLLYVVLSWVGAQLLLLVILGPSYWAGNVSEQLTCSFAQ